MKNKKIAQEIKELTKTPQLQQAVDKHKELIKGKTTEENLERLCKQAVIDFTFWLDQPQKPNTLQGSPMAAVLLEKYIEAKAILDTIKL